MKKMNWKRNLIAATCTTALAASMIGCSAATAAADTKTIAAAIKTTAAAEALPTAAGTILLSVNPEIEVEYDKKGLVLEIEGINDDGKTIITNYKDYQGKSCETVVHELVQKIYEAGCFDSTVEGHVKNIILKLENGSECPDDDFLEEVADGVRRAVDECEIKSAAMVVDDDDLNDKGLIGIEKAKELALAQLELEKADFTEREYDLDDNIYELEFTADGVEYEFEVNAVNGKVLKADYETNDDWDDFDDVDDDDNDDVDDDDIDDFDDVDDDDIDDFDDVDDDDNDDFNDVDDDDDDIDDFDDADDDDDDDDDIDDFDDVNDDDIDDFDDVDDDDIDDFDDVDDDNDDFDDADDDNDDFDDADDDDIDDFDDADDDDIDDFDDADDDDDDFDDDDNDDDDSDDDNDD